MANVRRVYAEKKPAYAVRAEELMNEIKEYFFKTVQKFKFGFEQLHTLYPISVYKRFYYVHFIICNYNISTFTDFK